MSIKAKIENIGYYNSPPDTYAAQRCKLDVYLPDTGNPPAIIFFHGGGLENEDRHSCLPLAAGLVSSGIAVILADYRLAPRATVPEFISDAAAAAGWTLKNAENLGTNLKQIFCGGYSAGAYLAAMIIQDKAYLQASGSAPENFAGLIAVSGQMVTHKLVRQQLGLNPQQPIINQYAPMYHAWQKSIDALCIVADNDMPNRLEENQYWLSVRKTAGCNNDKMLIQPNRDHGTIINGSDSPDEPTTKAISDYIWGK